MSLTVCFHSFISHSLSSSPFCVPASLSPQRIVASHGHHKNHTVASCRSGWACLEQGFWALNSSYAWHCHEAWVLLSGLYSTTRGEWKQLPNLWNTQHPVHNKCRRHQFNQSLIILATITFLFSSLLLTHFSQTPCSINREAIKAPK